MFSTRLLDDGGAMTGIVNLLVNVSDRAVAYEAAQRLAAIVETSADAILTKDLDGTITSWNGGAERLFGYSAGEIVGKSVSRLVLSDRPDEEPNILARIRTGKRIEHYETTRLRKDGSLVDISLSVSPIADHSGRIMGASTIARDNAATQAEPGGNRFLANAARLQRAAELLRHTNGSITHVSAEMGYSSPANFARAFRKATGHGPREFRSKM